MPANAYLRAMEMNGKWTRDEEGFMEFDSPSVQRYYESITDSYNSLYNQLLEEFDDEEEAFSRALDKGYELITDYKEINGSQEFVTTYLTPGYVLDVWFEKDAYTGKKVFDKGFVSIRKQD
jgi:hypothetical protein